VPDDIDAAFERARAFDAAGNDAEAQRAYLAVLDLDPKHFGALTNLANLMERYGQAEIARAGYREAVRAQPGNPAAQVNFGASLLDAGDLDAARDAFESALRLKPDCVEAHQGLAAVFAQLGDDEGTRRHRDRGFRGRSLVHVPFRGDGSAPRMLLLLAATGGNVDLRQFLNERRYDVWKLFADVADPAIDLPPHDLIFNAIGDADRSREALECAVTLLARTASPVLNAPRAVLASGRDANAQRLGAIAGVRTPRTKTFRRADLTGDTAGLHYPLLLRAPGHHTGAYCYRVENAGELADTLARIPGPEILALEFLDARSADGNVRKYRVMAIGGRLYPLHLAIAARWMVHYYDADNRTNAAHQVEERRFLEDMPGVLGENAVHALNDIAGMLALDYAGIDFSLDRDGNVLLFEANATMTIPPRASGAAYAQAAAAVDDLLWGTIAPHATRI
jgi:tetratricopeptide (TPR) repeat protein